MGDPLKGKKHTIVRSNEDYEFARSDADSADLFFLDDVRDAYDWLVENIAGCQNISEVLCVVDEAFSDVIPKVEEKRTNDE